MSELDALFRHGAAALEQAPRRKTSSTARDRHPHDVPSPTDKRLVTDSGHRPVGQRCTTHGVTLEVTADVTGLPTGSAEADGCHVLFEGVVHERDALRRELAGIQSASNADLFLAAYLRWGLDAFARIPGLFTVVVSDSRDGRLVAARDPLGIYPLFYAETGDDLVLSLSIEALLRHPTVPHTINRVALADHLCHRWPSIDETYFEAIRRVPAGTLLIRTPDGSQKLQRYWDPNPPGQPVDWVTESELGQFDALLERAVGRLIALGPVGIFLSGGLDSVTIAAIAADDTRALAESPPEGLSLVFEHESANEEALQRQVAAALGLPQTILPISQTLAGRGLLRSALDVSSRRSAPLLSLWEPAYEHLAAQGRDHGCHAILTGSGGDEWLEFNPAYSADLILGGQPRGALRRVADDAPVVSSVPREGCPSRALDVRHQDDSPPLGPQGVATRSTTAPFGPPPPTDRRGNPVLGCPRPRVAGRPPRATSAAAGARFESEPLHAGGTPCTRPPDRGDRARRDFRAGTPDRFRFSVPSSTRILRHSSTSPPRGC